MPGAGDNPVIQLALGQRRAFMRASRVECLNLSVDSEQGDVIAIDFDSQARSILQLFFKSGESESVRSSRNVRCWIFLGGPVAF